VAGSAFVVVPDGYGRVLAVSRGRGAWVWDLPGGRVDPGETRDMAAARELHEKTGMRPAGPLSVLIHRPEQTFFLLGRYAGVVRGSHEGDVAWLLWPELIARGGHRARLLDRLRVICNP